MLANLTDETRLHPGDMEAKAWALDCSKEDSISSEERLCVIANHLAEQRAKTVKAYVPIHFWVRPVHLKAMVVHARETVYALDVLDNGQAGLQAYAYHDVHDGWGDMVETGTVKPLPTPKAKALLKEMVAAGIRPPVMILKWIAMGNHFQAVHYQRLEHEAYAQNIATLVEARNAIFIAHGGQAMDANAYDPMLTARAAAAALTKVRKNARSSQGGEGVQAAVGSQSMGGKPLGIDEQRRALHGDMEKATDVAAPTFHEAEGHPLINYSIALEMPPRPGMKKLTHPVMPTETSESRKPTVTPRGQGDLE
ncbi:unnamed protein product [Phytophthora fragariaefolia]|uniref:Unnamed protein product n=1 Tax=Phytophthora fragariaefolia TaxID=1490495 RepID=A0A9W7CSK4_9STRA|nr:unnamed protein product [Phytophthora fragariaefolia]